MTTNKSALKSIKTAIDANDFASANNQAAELVKREPENYTALVFLGFARDKIDDDSGAEEAYLAAAKLKPADTQALKGLVSLCEKHGQKYLDRYHTTIAQLAEVFASLDDRIQCQSVIDKYEYFARKHGSQAQYRCALGLMLPTSSVYDFLEGRIPHPSHTFTRIIGSMESEEKDWTNVQIGERRTRLGAKIDQVVLDIKREAFAKYSLESLYQEAINWTNDDDLRRSFEERLLQRAYNTLLALPKSEKPKKRDQVLHLAKGMVIVKHAYELAWVIALEWVDAESMAGWDVGIFQEFIGFFPGVGLSMVLRGWLESDFSPFLNHPPEAPLEESDCNKEAPLSEADRLVLMVEGLDQCQNSLLAYRIMAETYLALGEHGSSAEVSRKAQGLHLEAIQKYGLVLQDSLDSINVTLASALTVYQSPRYHREALRIFEEILNRKPESTAVLSGIGLILEDEENFDEAVCFLTRASQRDPKNLTIKAELAWCRALSENMLTAGLTELEDTLALINEDSPVNASIKAELLYRIGFCQWQLNDPLYPRAQRNGPYRYFMNSLKLNPSYAPAYTMLGIFFEEYGRSPRRARTAFQKAFELSPGEIEAAHRLARLFAINGEWDLVELLAERVVQSGKAIPAPGSKKKAYSWPFTALGVGEINKQHYSRSIVHLQKALRVSPSDYHSWVSLGESYYNSGRYIAAERAFVQAEKFEESLPEDQTWFAKFMLANVRRATGAFGQAIEGYEAALTFSEDDFGVALALLQTYTESAEANLQVGRFYEASRQAGKALKIADRITVLRTNAFNLWKAVADAYSILATSPVYSPTVDAPEIGVLLERGTTIEAMETMDGLDGMNLLTLQSVLEDGSAESGSSMSEVYLIAGILASKRAVLATADNTHAQAVSWFNLGWMEHRISSSGVLRSGTKRRKCSQAATKCFKQAIELEASNAEFWDAFAVSAVRERPALAQHAFVRSLHLNDRSARVWTNLGAFYMVHNDHQLANDAFTRGQSADPEYTLAWLGQGLLATLVGDSREAGGLFTHAFDISDNSSSLVKQLYARSTFDRVVNFGSVLPNLTSLVQSLFALRQLYSQLPDDIASNHLTGLFLEHLGSLEEAEEKLQGVCAAAEEDYETSESTKALGQFLQAKCDVARVRLAQSAYTDAIDDLQLVLDLSSQDNGANGASMQAQLLQTLRLSALLTSGLAYHFLGQNGTAMERFQQALEETKRDPDVVCMLAQVLWSKGGSDERGVVQEQLFDCVERHPEHVGAVILLGVIAVLEEDQDAMEAVQGDLRSLRLDDKLDDHNRAKVLKVLAGVSAASTKEGDSVEDAAMCEAQREIMLSPGKPGGWAELTAITQMANAAEMALINSARNVPPLGDLDAGELGSAYAQTGRRSDALRGIMMAPWKCDGWNSLGECLVG